MDKLPVELLLKIISFVEMPVDESQSSFFVEKVSSKQMTKVTRLDCILCIDVVQKELKRLQCGVWDARFAEKLFSDFPVLVKKAFASSKQKMADKSLHKVSKLVSSSSLFCRKYLELCTLLTKQKSGENEDIAAQRSILVQFCRRLEEASMFPCWSLISQGFRKALLHSYASPLWKQWALRRWPQMRNASSSSSSLVSPLRKPPPSDWVWRDYCINRVAASRGGDLHHSVDNCFQLLCPMKISNMAQVGKDQYRCESCKETVHEVKSIEDLVEKAQGGQCVSFDSRDIHFDYRWPDWVKNGTFTGRPQPEWYKERFGK